MGITYTGYWGAVIDSPGVYWIDRDITVVHENVSGIYVNPGVHYVTIHLQSRIINATGSRSINRGIEFNSSSAVNVIGQGGSIRGFRWAVRMSNCYRPRVKGIVVNDGLFCGVEINGSDATVEDCDIREIHGTTFYSHERCRGISIYGARPTVRNNVIRNIRATGIEESLGVSIDDLGVNGAVIGNTMIQDELISVGTDASGIARKSFGVWIGGSSSVVCAHNTLRKWEVGIAYSSPPSGLVDSNTYDQVVEAVWDGGDGDVIRGDGDQDTVAA